MKVRRMSSLIVITGAAVVLAGLAGGAMRAQQPKPQGKPAAGVQATRMEWPQWHGPKRDNISTDVGLQRQWGPSGPPLAWQAAGLGAGFSSLAISNGRIYTMGDHGAEQFVEALNLADG
jgi:hypothetical protein